MFNRLAIGFVLTPGFRPADVIGIDAIFALDPRNKMHYVAENGSIVRGKSNLGLKPNTSFENCPDLEVLVIGETSAEQIQNDAVLAFLKKQAAQARYVITVSSGVLALYKAGVLTNQSVTADAKTLQALEGSSLTLVKQPKHLNSGKFYTAGPSTGAIEAAFAVSQKIRGSWLTQFIGFNLEYNPTQQYPVDQDTQLVQPDLPKVLKVGVFAPEDGFWPDVIGATDVFGCIPNAELYFINKQTGWSKSLLNLGTTIMADTSLQECPALDVLIFGASHPRYIKDPEVLDFILQQEKSTQAIISVCAGTFVIGAAGLLKGKRAATNYHQTPDLERVGAHYTGKEVENDDKYFSAGPAIGSYEAGLKAVEKIIGKSWAQYIEQQLLEFSPNPIQGMNHDSVKKSVLRVTDLAAIIARRLYRPSIKKGYYRNA